ncbi:MAG: hypothetical protein OXD01_07235 [Gammaproteobacteria bacterium]|nr:hypothetical protein [Gammaproteobacteria bacterium]
MAAVDPLSEFTPQRWAAAKRILTAEDNRRVSVTAAARAAEVTLHTFRAWERRSLEQRPEDSPLIHEIAQVLKYRDEYIADTLEDVGWDRAMNGSPEDVYHKGEVVGRKAKQDNTLLFKMMQAHNRKRYGDKSELQVNHKIDISEIYQRMLAGQKMAETLAARGAIIDGEAKVMEVAGELAIIQPEAEVPVSEPSKAQIGDIDMDASIEF